MDARGSCLELITADADAPGAWPDLAGVGEDGEEKFGLSGYFAQIAAAIVDKPRWEVLPDDIVLGFFSFAKFLMYRDLDPATWPRESPIDGHPLVASLLGEGFEPGQPLIGEYVNIDFHLTPADLLHVVDARQLSNIGYS